MRESQVEREVSFRAEKAGWFHRKVKWEGRAGAPDHVFIKDGRTVWIEFKRPGRNIKPGSLQSRERTRMVEHGAEYHQVDAVEQGVQLLGLV